jgi:SH3-like domain-containing protein
MGKLIIFFSIFVLLQNNLLSQEEYFLTLRNDKVNLRQGPSFEHPIKLVYEKKFLPVLVKERSDNFRKILDHENNSGWIHVSQLSKKKAAINDGDNSVLFKKPSLYSEPIAIVEKGRLCLVKKCNDSWCKIKTGDFSGWMEKRNLKGRL